MASQSQMSAGHEASEGSAAHSASSENRPTCIECRFFRAKGQKCQRLPPAVVFDVGTLERVVMFPRVAASMWCGEFSAMAEEPTTHQATISRLTQALAAAKAEIEQLKTDRAHEPRRLQIEAFEAETNRLRALQK